ncbi:MAG: sodium:alanine symporter family protein [Phycisphaeraceae bacterium]|nr:sodium:alanine symporter family protein [Phycisphaeraceae bacterium]
MKELMDVLNVINGVIWHQYVLFFLLGVGVLFTLWSGFCQFRALTHGVAVVRGKYDDKNDPGAINHFQALSTALSATVGLGNIAGVAIAISLGGPGAVFWMWVVGLCGMALKLTEVTQAMLFRDTSDPENPKGGAMWVCKRGFAKLNPGLAPLGAAVGGLFCVTLLISCVTGGNMFQAWNVADIGFTYFGIPQIVTGILFAVLVGIVIIGGIKRIGDIAGKIVPFMCAIYILAGLFVIITRAGEIPAMFALIFREAFAPSEAVGAFIGGTMGYGFLKGMQRALFSNEAGQGSAPIAHSAAKTDEPVREGVVAGLEPFIDTICVCTITALVILLSGAWSRDPVLTYGDQAPRMHLAEGQTTSWTADPTPITIVNNDQAKAEAKNQLKAEAGVFLVVEGARNSETGGTRHRLNGTVKGTDDEGYRVEWKTLDLAKDETPRIAIPGVYFDFKGATLTAKAYDRVIPNLGFWIVPAVAFLFAFSTMISWSYYGEQGVVYLFGSKSVMPYRIVYCILIMAACAGLIQTQDELDVISTLGTGVMLWVNIPIMLIFGPMAMKAYRDYMGKLKSGEMKGHAYPKAADVIEGKDVE